MTNEELDDARETEAIRIYDLEQDDPNAHGVARVAARLAREGWTPDAVVDPDGAEARELFESWANNDEPTPENVVLRAIKRGRELERAETAPPVAVDPDLAEAEKIRGNSQYMFGAVGHIAAFVQAIKRGRELERQEAKTEMGEPRLVIGEFHITRLECPGRIWIGRTNGEGGDFSIYEFERMLKGFYEDGF